MSSTGIDNKAAGEPGTCCIVGFGNPYRQDDGVGPWIVKQLGRQPAGRNSVRLISGHQMSPDLLDNLRDASRIILIDASVKPINDGWKWEAVEPREALPSSLHSFHPGFLLHLLERLYGNRPETWLISIQGESFDYGEGLSPSTEKWAGEVISAMDEFLSKEGNYGDWA